MDLIKAVIVGCGNISYRHADILNGCEGVSLYGAYDIDEWKSIEFARKYNIKKYNRFEDILNDDIASIHICTPHNEHTRMVKKAIDANKYTVVEKPVSTSMSDLNDLWGLANSGKSNMVMPILQNRYNNCVIKVREIMCEGRYGKLVGMRSVIPWRRDEEYYMESGGWRAKVITAGGGAVINQAIHVIDLMDCFGQGATSIIGGCRKFGLKDFIEVEDTAEGLLLFDNGCRAVFYTTTSYVDNQPAELTFSFERGTIRYLNHKLFDDRFTLLAEDFPLLDNKKRYWGNGHKKIIENFYSSILGETIDIPTLKDGIRATEICLGLYETINTEKPYIMKYPNVSEWFS